VTGSAKSGLIAHDRKFNFFVTNTKTHQYTINFHCQNEVLGGLLLLAATSQPIGNPYEQSGSIMELWWEGRALSVTVHVLNKDLCCLLAIILAGYEPCVAHIKVYFTYLPSSDIFFINPLPAIHLPASLPLLSSPNTTIWEPTLVEKLSKMSGNLFLVYLARGWSKR